MLPDALKAYLATDVVDSTATIVYNANTDLFSSPSAVPDYCYTSLSTLMGVASADLPTRIIPAYGEDVTPSSLSIIFQPDVTGDSVNYPTEIRSDYQGAEYENLCILVRAPGSYKNASLIRSIQLRIRFLIDQNLRQYRNLPPGIAITEDDSVLDQYLRCFWKRSGTLFAVEQVSYYSLNFIRAFPHT